MSVPQSTVKQSDRESKIDITTNAVEVSYKYDEASKSFVVVGSKWRNPHKRTVN